MVLFRCPNCQMQVCVANNSGDYVHECNSGNLALDREDILVQGPWTDYTGSDFTVRVSPPSIVNQNLGNSIDGTEANIRDNIRVPPYTIRGNNAQINRQRQHLQYIENPHRPMG